MNINKYISYLLCNKSIIVNLYKLKFPSFIFFLQPNKRVFHPLTFPPLQPNTKEKKLNIFYPPSFSLLQPNEVMWLYYAWIYISLFMSSYFYLSKKQNVLFILFYVFILSSREVRSSFSLSQIALQLSTLLWGMRMKPSMMALIWYP